jgi:hypothetical protein
MRRGERSTQCVVLICANGWTCISRSFFQRVLTDLIHRSFVLDEIQCAVARVAWFQPRVVAIVTFAVPFDLAISSQFLKMRLHEFFRLVSLEAGLMSTQVGDTHLERMLTVVEESGICHKV